MSTKYIFAAVAAMMASGLSAQADTGYSKADTVIRISGYVPVICRVQMDTPVSAADENGIANLGLAEEFCNAPRGYRVFVNHPANLEGAAVIRSGVRIPLSSTGETLLTDSSHADIQLVTLAVDLGDEPQKFHSIGVRIEART